MLIKTVKNKEQFPIELSQRNIVRYISDTAIMTICYIV